MQFVCYVWVQCLPLCVRARVCIGDDVHSRQLIAPSKSVWSPRARAREQTTKLRISCNSHSCVRKIDVVVPRLIAMTNNGAWAVWRQCLHEFLVRYHLRLVCVKLLLFATNIFLFLILLLLLLFVSLCASTRHRRGRCRRRPIDVKCDNWEKLKHFEGTRSALRSFGILFLQPNARTTYKIIRSNRIHTRIQHSSQPRTHKKWITIFVVVVVVVHLISIAWWAAAGVRFCRAYHINHHRARTTVYHTCMHAMAN